MGESIRLAFVGNGNWANKYHFPALDYLRQEGSYPLHLHGIYSLDPQRDQETAQRYGFERVYASLDELLADESITAIAATVSPAALVTVMRRLVERGLPIFSEKPPGRSYADAQALAELVDLPNVLAFNRRYIPLNNQFKQIVDQMQDVYFVEGHFFRHNRQDPIFVLETGVHWINFVEYLFGPIRTVRNEHFPHPRSATPVRLAYITFASGLRGLLKFFPCTGAQGERLEVHSPRQTAYLYGPLWTDPGEIIIEENEAHETLHQQRLVRRTIPGSHGPEILERGIVGEYEEFFQAILTGQPTRSNFQNGANTLRIAEAIEYGRDLEGDEN
jgi:predicted dehydrogenase